jgi:MFS family permease
MGAWRVLLGTSVFWSALSMVSDGVTTLILPQRIANLDDPSGRATVLGLATFIGIFVGMLVQPLAGRVSDQLRARQGRMATIAAGLAVLVPALALLAFFDGLTSLVVAFVLVQIGLNVAQAGQQGFIPDLIPRERRGAAAGLKGLMDLVGAFVGFALLGALLASGDARPAILALVAAVIGCFLLTVLLVREGTGGKAFARAGGVLDAFRFDLGRHRAFATLVISRFLFLLGTYMVGRFFLFFVADRLGLDPGDAAKNAGGLLAALTLVTALAAPAGGWAADRWGRIPLMVFGGMASVSGVLLLTLAATSAQILACGALMAVGSGAFAAANWAFTTDLVPPEEAARFMGLANFGTAGAAAFAGLAGPLVDWGNSIGGGSGYVALFVMAALAFGVSAIVLRPISQMSRLAHLAEARAG